MARTVRARPRADLHDFTAYVEERQQGLLGFAILVCGNRTDAEDLLQTVLGRAHLRWDRLVAEDVDLDAYVRTSIVNASTSLWRRAFRRREQPSDRLPERAAASAGDASPGSPGDLWTDVLGLPERQRQVVALRYYEGLTVAETATVMGTSEGTVKSQCARALDRLRITLSEEGR